MEKTFARRVGHGSDFQKVKDHIYYIAKRSFRRTLVDNEFDGLSKIYNTFKKSHGHNHAMMEVVRSIMVSPNFLFRTELLGVDKVEGNLARLDEFALASRLSFFLWNSGPDDHLA